MTTRKRVVYSAALKAKVAMAALRGDRTVSQLGGQFGVHPVQVAKWKRRLVEQAAELFQDGRRRPSDQGPDERELYEEIGRLKVELDWLKRKAAQLD